MTGYIDSRTFFFRPAKCRGTTLQASASHHGYRGPAALDFQVVFDQQLRDVLKFEFKGSPGPRKTPKKHSTAAHCTILSTCRCLDNLIGCAATKLLA